jgi:hypothetical protein
MPSHLRAFSLPVGLSLLLAFLLPCLPAAAQDATPDAWRKGASTVSDNFSVDEGQWTVDSGRDPLRSVARGRLRVRVPEPEFFRWSTLDKVDGLKNFYAEVDGREETGAADAMLGMIFRYEDVDNFYALLVSVDGWYALFKYVDGEASRPIDWSQSDAIETGKGAENRLGVLADGRELAIYTNGEELDRVQDRSFAEGQIGLLAASSSAGGLEVSFDNFGLWNEPGNTSPTPAIGRKTLRRSTPTAPERPADAPDALVTSDSLNVRGGPGTNYSVVGALKKGDGVKVAGRSPDNKWAKLGFADVPEAWASAQYLDFQIDFGQVAVAKAAPAPAQPPKPPAQPAKKNVAWLKVENHIGRYITLQVNDQNFRVEGKVGETPGKFQFELQGVGRYRIAAQLPNGGSHNWDLYVEPTPDKCASRQGCVALGQTFLQTYY